jgi:4-phytase/acid phosphatase
MRPRILAVLVLFGSSLYLIGQALAPSSPADDTPKLVVALFRHGIRSPTPDFNQVDADKDSGDKWPALEDWNVIATPDCDKGNGWGYLTTHGQSVVQGLGAYYGEHYLKAWKNGFNVYLWADSGNQRTRETANALKVGLKNAGVPESRITVDWQKPDCSTDPLFHPFKAGCGIPDSKTIRDTVAEIEKGRKEAEKNFKANFEQLYGVLNCTGAPCEPLKGIIDAVSPCTDLLRPPAKCGSPITWSGTFNGQKSSGRFPYASSASEAFLLEYANDMPLTQVGWGKVNVAENLHSMLQLHETYFTLTDRETYLAKIEGSNLIREILNQLERKAGRQPPDGCLRANADSDFVGLVGHDTNLANVGALLGLEWKFDDQNLPADIKNLPANDALPAGALVFELRKHSDGVWFVRVEYVTQSLDQMRDGPTNKAFPLAVDGMACSQKRPCEIRLETFEKLVAKRIGSQFLSTCTNGEPRCGAP